MNIDPSTTKYLIKAKIVADGIVEKPDVVGAIFGQTEGLLGDELDLRDLQKSGRMGRIEVEITSKKGKSEGEILMPSSLDQVETAILASALETIDRVGPCKAQITVLSLEDVRVTKKAKIVDRAKELLGKLLEETKNSGSNITDMVRQAFQVQEISHYGHDRCPAGPNIDTSDAIIIVEGRSDVLNLLKHGIKNAIAVEGTNIPKTIQDLSKEKTVTAFVDGDRGGELILKELLQTCEVDYIARAPRGREVEELTQKQIMKALTNKVSAEQFLEMYGFEAPAEKEDEFRGDAEDVKSFESVPKSEQPKKVLKQETSVPTAAQNTGADTTQKPALTAPRAEADSATQPAASNTKLTETQQKYKEILSQLAGTFHGYFLGKDGEVLKEVAVRDLAESLKEPPQGTSVVIFDGVITQRLLDLSVSKNIRTVVGVKCGNITKVPPNLEI
ncbi:MAG: DNA primase DnaG, partial [Thermoplasmata archaeon]